MGDLTWQMQRVRDLEQGGVMAVRDTAGEDVRAIIAYMTSAGRVLRIRTPQTPAENLYGCSYILELEPLCSKPAGE